MTNEIVTQVNGLLQQGFELEPEKLVPTARLIEDLGLDSLDAVDMMVYIEERFGKKLQAERMLAIKTLQDVYALVEELASSAPIADSQNQISH